MTTTTKLFSLFALVFAVSSTLRAGAPIRLLHDRAHGETPLAEPMKAIVNKLGATFAETDAPITPETLAGVHLLYLRAPSTAFTAPERQSIIAFIKAGGALLLVLDEENRQSLAVTQVNEIIAPFGLKLTGDLPYLHNCGAVAKAGAINAADRELPYSGGRAVEGGTPFAYVLNKDGKPAEAFAARAELPEGARIVVLSEGMASLFLGKPEGVRLTGVPRDVKKTTYWGQDSAIFMEEVVTWLLKK